MSDTANVSGKHTCSYTKFSENGSSKWLITAYYYDKYGRLIQTREKNQHDGYDITSIYYTDLTSSVGYTIHEQTATLGNTNYSHTEESTSYFDHAGRLEQNRYKINSNPLEQVVVPSYNSLGQITQKNLYNGTLMQQSVDYSYNIKGALLSINDAALSDGENDLFGMEIIYNKADSELPNIPRHNGNISAIKYQNVGSGMKSYTYDYNSLGQLKDGNYAEQSGGTWSYNDKYSEKNITYDLNGNITHILRSGLKYPNYAVGIIDNLAYYYKGNKLIGVNDKVTSSNFGDFSDNGFVSIPNPENQHTWEYNYDDNGNLTSDKNKGIVSITYNYLNQPINIDMGGGKRICYLYDASGRRLQKTDYLNGTPVTTTDYIANFVYNNNVVSYAQTLGGRIVFTTMTNTYCEQYITDHLGNIRAAYQCSTSGLPVLKQSNEYYPYGLLVYRNAFSSSYPNEYYYQCKELDNENGLNWYNFHSRMYDPVLCRWNTPDPAQQYISPYLAMGNDPVNRIDPNGMEDSKNKLWKSLSAISGGFAVHEKERQRQFFEMFPAANSGNIDWSAGYWGHVTGIDGGAGSSNSTLSSSIYGWASNASLTGYNANNYNDKSIKYITRPDGDFGHYERFYGGYVGHDSKNGKLSGPIIGNRWVSNNVSNSGYDITVPYVLAGMESTDQALKHYYDQTGSPIMLGNNTIELLINSKKFQEKHRNIISGQTTSLTGDFSVEMSWKVFHIGSTNVNYSISVGPKYCTVTYELFVNDGFWDVDSIDENAFGWLNISKFQPDGPGSNLERGGTPFPYIPIKATCTFPNPGYR